MEETKDHSKVNIQPVAFIPPGSSMQGGAMVKSGGKSEDIEKDELVDDGNVKQDQNQTNNEGVLAVEDKNVLFTPQVQSSSPSRSIKSVDGNEEKISSTGCVLQSGVSIANDEINREEQNEGGNDIPQVKIEGNKVPDMNTMKEDSDDSGLVTTSINTNEQKDEKTIVKEVSDTETCSVKSGGDANEENESDKFPKETNGVANGNLVMPQSDGNEDGNTSNVGSQPGFAQVTMANNQLIVAYVGATIPILPFDLPEGLNITYVEKDNLSEITSMAHTQLIPADINADVNETPLQNTISPLGEGEKTVDEKEENEVGNE